MNHNSGFLIAVGGVGTGAKYAKNPYVDAIGWEDALSIFLILGGIIFVCGYILSVLSKGKRKPPDTLS